jgi:hypothetical protein
MGHHFVPQFLLRNWSESGRLVSYYFEGGANRVIENDKATVASACQIADLNRFFGVPKAKRDFPETKFFTPRVDTPAATALDVILKKGINNLTTKQRFDWARLLVSFGVRTPETLQQMGPLEVTRAFDLVEAAATGPAHDEQKVTTHIRANMARYKRNFPLNAAMELSTDPEKLTIVEAMTWWTRRWTRPVILIGDRPLLTSPRMKYSCGIPLDCPTCLITLPISPTTVFFASASRRTRTKMSTMNLGRVGSIVNDETIWRSTCVFFPNKSLSSFVMPRVAGKANGTWQPRTK